jgi:hypothetical protein
MRDIKRMGFDVSKSAVAVYKGDMQRRRVPTRHVLMEHVQKGCCTEGHCQLGKWALCGAVAVEGQTVGGQSQGG